MKYLKLYENSKTGEFILKYERWRWGGYSEGYYSWGLYKNGILVSAVSNNNNNKNDIIIRDIQSKEKGMATKLIFMLLDKNIKIETGKPNYNSISTAAYYMNKKIVNLIKNNSEYKYTILGKSNNDGKEDYEPYIDVIDKEDNFHYRFEKSN